MNITKIERVRYLTDKFNSKLITREELTEINQLQAEWLDINYLGQKEGEALERSIKCIVAPIPFTRHLFLQVVLYKRNNPSINV